jgi:hypothetical protein
MAQLVMTLGQDGAYTYETMRAFSEDEHADLVGGLP